MFKHLFSLSFAKVITYIYTKWEKLQSPINTNLWIAVGYVYKCEVNRREESERKHLKSQVLKCYLEKKCCSHFIIPSDLGYILVKATYTILFSAYNKKKSVFAATKRIVIC